jgi:hypothetical protein
MESMLSEDFLFGSTPCIADFSAYHGLWFVSELAGKPWLRDFPKVKAWMARMTAFGHGEFREITADQALDIARDALPRTIEAAGDDPLAGKHVEISPDDYGREPVTGKLVYADDQTLVLGRSHKRVGQVHVHFPRQGFAVKPA